MKILARKEKPIPAFEVGRSEAIKKAATKKAKLVKFKVGLLARKYRDDAKIVLRKKPSKHTPKGTIAKVKELIAQKLFVPKKEKRVIEATRLRICKSKKLAKAA